MFISLFVYYLENSLQFEGIDIAIVFIIMGGLGIIVQGCCIKLVNDKVGEQNVIIIAFSFGFIHNLLYGVATNKTTIFIAVALSSIAGMSFPTISAIKSIIVVSYFLLFCRAILLWSICFCFPALSLSLYFLV